MRRDGNGEEERKGKRNVGACRSFGFCLGLPVDSQNVLLSRTEGVGLCDLALELFRRALAKESTLVT
jgi:hypothetical protein